MLVVIALLVVFLLTATSCDLFDNIGKNNDNKEKPSTEQWNNNPIGNPGTEIEDPGTGI